MTPPRKPLLYRTRRRHHWEVAKHTRREYLHTMRQAPQGAMERARQRSVVGGGRHHPITVAGTKPTAHRQARSCRFVGFRHLRVRCPVGSGRLVAGYHWDACRRPAPITPSMPGSGSLGRSVGIFGAILPQLRSFELRGCGGLAKASSGSLGGHCRPVVTTPRRARTGRWIEDRRVERRPRPQGRCPSIAAKPSPEHPRFTHAWCPSPDSRGGCRPTGWRPAGERLGVRCRGRGSDGSALAPAEPRVEENATAGRRRRGVCCGRSGP